MSKLLTEEIFKKWGNISGIDKTLTENAFQRVYQEEEKPEDEMDDMDMGSEGGESEPDMGMDMEPDDEMGDMDMDMDMGPEDEGFGGELELSKDDLESLEVAQDVLNRIMQASGSDMELDETSSMSGGSSSGYMGSKNIGNKENKMKPIKEEDLDEKDCSDKELEEELAESLARKTYDKFLQEQRKSKKRREMLENIDVEELSERIQKRLQEYR